MHRDEILLSRWIGLETNLLSYHTCLWIQPYYSVSGEKYYNKKSVRISLYYELVENFHLWKIKKTSLFFKRGPSNAKSKTKHDLCQTGIYSSKDKSVMMNLGKYLKCKGTVCFLFRPQYPIFSHLNAFTVLVHLRC